MLRATFRGLSRNPGFTATAILTLALGIGANTAMFSVVDGVLLKPLAYREPNRLVCLDETVGSVKDWGLGLGTTDTTPGPFPPQYYESWRDHATLLESIALLRPSSVNLTGSGEPERLLSAHVSASFLPTLGVRPALGRSFGRNEDVYQGPRLAILSDAFWRRHFAADRGVLGRKLQLNGEPYTVIGVMSPQFELPLDLPTHASHFDLLLPADIGPGAMNMSWCIARLKPGVTIAQASAELDAILRAFPIHPGPLRKTEIAPLPAVLTTRVERGLSLLMAAVALVLLIACANLANLLVSRGLTRRKEIAVRSALGAGRSRIIRHLFSESLVLSALGGGAGAMGAVWILEGILTQLPQELPHRSAISLDPRALVFCLAVTFVSALVFGALPAWRFSKAAPQEALGQSQRGATETRGSDALRRWLIAGQVALCTMLLIGSGLLLRSLAKVLHIERGFQTENVVTAEVPIQGVRYAGSDLVIDRREQASEAPPGNDTYRAIEEKLAAIPGVSAAGAVSWPPLSGMQLEHPIVLPNQALAPDYSNLSLVMIRFATPGYFRAAGIPLRSGRLYSSDAADRWAAVVSESVARRLWPERDPIGQEFTFDEPGSLHRRFWHVAGVVADVRQAELQDPAPATVYLSLPTYNLGADLSFVIRTKLPVGTVAPAIRQAVWQVDSNLPVTAIRPMSDLVAASTAQQRFQILLLASFASVAVLLAALGIYGTLSYSVNQRFREIGIRLALGAQRRDVGILMVRHALTPVVLGLVAGCGGALILMRALSSLLYGVGAGDAITYSAVGALVLIVAAASSWLPARRAMRLDPVETMRCE